MVNWVSVIKIDMWLCFYKIILIRYMPLFFVNTQVEAFYNYSSIDSRAILHCIIYLYNVSNKLQINERFNFIFNVHEVGYKFGIWRLLITNNID